MRKYKDVGKRILVLILSICMFSTLFTEVPVQAADDFPSNGVITLGADMNGAQMEGSSYIYAGGKEIKPSVQVVIGGIVQDPSTYTTYYRSNTNAGSGYIDITGLTSSWNVTKEFTIAQQELDFIGVNYKGVSGEGASSYVFYTGSDVLPTITGVYGIISGSSGTQVNLDAADYEIKYNPGNNTSAGAHAFQVILKSNSNYKFTSGVQDRKYNIYYNLASDTVRITSGLSNSIYTGSPQCPPYTVGDTLNAGMASGDYTESWSTNTDAGTGHLTLTANMSSLYRGSKTFDFKIEKADLTGAGFSLALNSAKYYYIKNSKPDMSGEVTVKLNGVLMDPSNYTVNYLNADAGKVGLNTLQVKSKDTGNLKEAKTIQFYIYDTLGTAELSGTELEYTNARNVPDIIVKNTFGETIADEHYTVTYYKNSDYTEPISDPKAMGTYYIKIEGTGYYEGTIGTPAIPLSYTIVPKSLDKCTFNLFVDGVDAGVIDRNSNYYGFYDNNEKVLSLKAVDDKSNTLNSDDFTYEVYNDEACTDPADENPATTQKEILNARTYYIKVTGVEGGNYAGSERVFSYTVKPMAVAPLGITITPQTYTGTTIVPDVSNITVKYNLGGHEQTIGSENIEVVSASQNVNIGTNTATAVIKLKGNYVLATGAKNSGKFSIVPRKLSECSCNLVSGSPNYDPSQTNFIYNGLPQTPMIRITDNDGAKTLREETDYTVKYYSDEFCTVPVTEPTNVGTYYVKISGRDIYANTDADADIKVSYVILAKDLSLLMAGAPNMSYDNGNAVTPTVKVMDGTTELVYGTDYEIEGYYTDADCTHVSAHSEAGKVYIRLKAKAGSNYTGMLTTSFFIGSDLSGIVGGFNVSGGTYNRNSHKADVLAAIRSRMNEVLPDPTSYQITFYSDAEYRNAISDDADLHYINAGSLYYKIAGKKNYYGDIYGMAAIAPKDITELNALVRGTYTYNGLDQHVDIATDSVMDGVVLQYPSTNGYILNGTEYKILFSTDAKNAGLAQLTLQALPNGNYTGTKTVTYTIGQRDLNSMAGLKLTVGQQTFANKVLVPEVRLTYGDSAVPLTPGDDYRTSCFTDAAFADISLNADLTNRGTNYVKVEGKGNYKGVLTSADCETTYGSNQFIINPLNIENVGVSLEGKSYMFSHNIPSFEVTQEFPKESGSGTYGYILDKSIDYDYSPTGITDYKIGRQNLTITGKGNFTGTRNSYFFYNGNLSNSANQVEVVLQYEETEYDQALAEGDGMRPTVGVSMREGDRSLLSEGTDYTLSYRNNKVPGMASVVITAKEGSYWVGSYTATFKITGKINDAEIRIPSQVYTGSSYNDTTQQIQNMQVVCDGKTLILGTDYRIKTIANAAEVSLTAPSVTIEGMGDYFSGEKTANFAIKYDLASSNLIIDLGGDTFPYTGTAITPAVTVKYRLTDTTYATLDTPADYTFEYFKNTDVGAANGDAGPHVVVRAADGGKLTGSTRSQAFSIEYIHLEDYEITGVDDSYTYTGKLIKPNSLRLTKRGGTEVIDPANYDIYYETDASNPASAPAGATETITVLGKGNYDGMATKTFTITKRNLSATTRSIDDQTYSGEELKPEVKFTFNDENGIEQTLAIGTDYNVLGYQNNINAASKDGANAPNVTVQGVNSCTGSVTESFHILKKNVADLAYSAVEDMDFVPLQTRYEPSLDVYMSTTSTEALEKDVVYTLKYFNNDKVADADGTTGPYILITPKDTTNYTGTHTIPFSILAKDIASPEIEGTLSDSADTGFDPATRNYPYRPGVTYTPTVGVKDNSVNGVVGLNNGTDYIYEYSTNNNQVGTAYVKITGQGNYTGTRLEKFTIGTLLSEATVTVTGISDKEYNGLDTAPTDIKVKFNQTGEYLTKDSDYIVKYFIDEDCLTEASAIDLIHAGTIYVGIVGTENALTGFVGTVVIPYRITRKSLTSPDIEITGNEDMDFTGGSLEPVLTLKDKSTGLLIDTTQYEVRYENCTEIGTASATVTAAATGNYKDSITVYYKVTKHDIGKLVAEAIPDQTYTGDYIRPEVTIYDNGTLLREGFDFEVVNGNNLRAGKAWVVIKGINNYDQTKNVYFNIVASLEQAQVEEIPDQFYTGSAITPPVKVACGGNTLELGEDYTVTYAQNTAIGDASVTIRPLRTCYTGTIVKKFRITNSIELAAVTGIPSSVLYDGTAHTPEPVVMLGGKMLTKGIDYTVAYKNNVSVGIASVIIRGEGKYSRSKTLTFRITEKSVNNCTIFAVASQTYNGRLQTPPIVVKDGTHTLTQGIEYTLAYSNNIDVGTAYITIAGRGDYKGSATRKFAIVEPKTINNVMIQNKNSSAGTFDVVIDGAANFVNSISVPVWTKADQSDIVWYQADRISADTFIAHVNMRNHQNNVGVYYVHVYAASAGSFKCVNGMTTTFGNNYENIFDYEYYIAHNPDVANAFGGNTEAVFNHFVNCGMKEGRCGIDGFNVASYRARYADLRAAFGTNLAAYYTHYKDCGKREGRITTGSTEYQNTLTVYNGIDYRLVFDYNYYTNKYPDIKSAFNGDETATLRHFVENGMREGRQAKADFSVGRYKQKYSDLRSAFGNNARAYYEHYIAFGYREGRTAN